MNRPPVTFKYCDWRSELNRPPVTFKNCDWRSELKRPSVTLKYCHWRIVLKAACVAFDKCFTDSSNYCTKGPGTTSDGKYDGMIKVKKAGAP